MFASQCLVAWTTLQYHLCYPKNMDHAHSIHAIPKTWTTFNCAIAHICDVIVLDMHLIALREVNSNMIFYK